MKNTRYILALLIVLSISMCSQKIKSTVYIYPMAVKTLDANSLYAPFKTALEANGLSFVEKDTADFNIQDFEILEMGTLPGSFSLFWIYVNDDTLAYRITIKNYKDGPERWGREIGKQFSDWVRKHK
jgi:hypothetical protein